MESASSGCEPGAIVAIAGDAVLVRSGDGCVSIDRLVPPNRSAMSGAAFAMSK
jgi:methionyl-tRNA formyltransferase